MFAKPRPKKSILPPPPKKRRAAAIEEISFDNDARHEYLTGFHKRKQQRIKHAQEEAAKKARQEKIEIRKQTREDRKREVEEHVAMVNKMLEESGAAGAYEAKENEDGSSEEENAWEGFPDRPDLEMVDHEEEYIDEDRYTTVTVESVNVSRDGFEKPVIHEAEEDEEAKVDTPKPAAPAAREESRPPKPKKKKFRYENKFERKLTDSKQRAKSHKRR